MTLSIEGLFATLSINYTQHNNTMPLLQNCHYAECHIVFIVILNVVMLNVIMLKFKIALTVSYIIVNFRTKSQSILNNICFFL
jgi:hypothetical protein